MPTNTSGGTTTSLSNTPQATDNCYVADEDLVYTFDVMADDLGGNAKILWSIDDANLYGTTTTSADGTTQTTTNVDTTIDLTVRDAIGCVEKSQLGASIWIESGKVKYDARALDWLAQDQQATDYFTYAIRLANGTLSWATVKVTLTGTNDAPTIVAAGTDAVGAVTEKAEPNEGGTLSYSATISFADVDLTDTHSATVSTDVVDENGDPIATPLGALVLDPVDQADNSVGWTFSVDDSALDFLAAGESLTQVYTVTISDGHTGGTVTQTVSVTIHGTNDAPEISVATGDGASAELDETDSGISTSGTLTLSDVDLSDLVDVLVTDVAVNGTGGVGSLCETDLMAMLTLSGHQDNAADGTAGSLGWSFDSNGEAFDYLAAGETLVLNYTLTASDGNGGSDPQTVTVTITGTNDAPVLTIDASGSVTEDIDVSGGLLSDSGTLSIADLDATDTHGVSAVNTGVTWSDGTLDPAVAAALIAGFSADLTGWDYSIANEVLNFLAAGETVTLTFDVTASDDSGAADDSDTETVTIIITGSNDAPTVSGIGSATAGEDGAAPNLSLLLLASDPDHNADLDVDNVTYEVTSANWADPVSYSVDEETGELTIDPAQFNTLADGEEVVILFSYTVLDEQGASAPASFAVTITGSNDAPVVTGAVQATADEDDANPASVDLLGNASDPDRGANPDVANVSHLLTDGSWSPPFTYSVDPATGAMTFDPGQFNALAAGESVEFTISYDVVDEQGAATAATAVVTITGSNDAPTVSGVASVSADEDDPAPSVPLLLLASDPDRISELDVDSVTYEVTSANWSDPVVHSVDEETGELTIDPAQFNALDEGEEVTILFSYTVLDEHGASAPASFAVTITGSNDAPVVAEGISDQQVNEDQPWSFVVPSEAFSDVDGDALEYSATLGNGNALPSWLAFDAASGTFSGTPPQDFFGTIDLKVTASDGELNISDTFTLTINPINDAPTASPVTLAAIAEDSGERIITTAELLGGADDVDSSTLEITNLSIGSGGGVLEDNGDGTWTYTPAANDDTSVTFNYTVSDGELSADSTASLDITPVNDAPVNTVPGAQTATAGTGAAIAGVAVSDIDTANLETTVSVAHGTVTVGTPVGATITGNGSGSVTISGTQSQINAALAALIYTATSGYGGSDTLTVTTSDGAITDEDTVAITVEAGNAPPTANGDNVITNVSLGTPFAIPEWALLNNDSDADGDTLDVAAVAGASGGSAVHNAGTGSGGNVTFTDPAPAGGSFTYTATDGTTASSSATVTVTRDALGDLNGTAGADILIGSGPVTFVGGDGNDVLIASTSGSNNNYQFDLSDGSDVINDASGVEDRVRIVTTTSTDAIGTLNFERVENNLVIDVGATEIVIRNHYSGTPVEKIQFTNGGTLFGYSFGTSDYLLSTDNTGALNGDGNQDVIASSSGTETLNGMAGNDLLFGNGGVDTINGNDGSDLIVGGDGNDILNGNNGNDVLVGGLGQDSLSGGGDPDRFVFTDIAETTVAAADTITGFSTSNDDVIDLSRIDANSGSGGDQAFAFIGTGAFTGTAGQLRYQQSGGNTFVEGDVNGDGVADFAILLTGTHTLTASGSASDFVL